MADEKLVTQGHLRALARRVSGAAGEAGLNAAALVEAHSADAGAHADIRQAVSAAQTTADGANSAASAAQTTANQALSAAGNAAYSRTFTASGWTASSGVYTLTIAKSAHGRTGGAFGWRLWHSVDSRLRSDTWAVAGTQVIYNSSDGSVTLSAGEAYAGTLYLYDL